MDIYANYARKNVVFLKNLHSWHKFYMIAGRNGRDKSQLWRALNLWVCCALSQFLFAFLLSCVCERVLVLWKLLGRCPILVPPTLLFGQHCKRFWLFWYNYNIPFKIRENSWTLNIGRKLDWEYLQSWKRGINWNWIGWNDTQCAYKRQIFW